MANSSSAYDFSAFAARPQEKQQVSQPQLRMVRSQNRAIASVFTPRILCAFAVVVTLVSLIVYNQVCLNEVTAEISQLNSDIAILESESVRFASLLESTISLRAVAQQAEDDLGMTKLDQYQTVYVYLYEEDRIILAEGPEDSGGGLKEWFEAVISTAKEYIGG